MNAPIPLYVDAGHPAFDGHFPGAPLLPGALLLDEVLRRLPDSSTAATGAIHLAAVKFRRPVRPGTALTLTFEPLADGSARFIVRDPAAVVLDGTVRRT
jgi:3-hydroxymyristoyl/3-hydroxydecanoyl-(acyl carrier protein) dehydratase